MKLFEEEYKTCLHELNQKYEQERDPQKASKILSDISYIHSYLYSHYSNYRFVGKSFEEKKKFLDYSQLQKLKKCKVGYYKTIRVNKELMKKITQEFINLKVVKLKDVYDRIKSYDGIGYEYEYDVDKAINGATIYIKSLNKNYIKIFLTGKLSDYSTCVHELGHARVNTMCKDIDEKQKFIEVYPIFLELLFADYLKVNNMQKASYNLKLSMLNKTKKFLDEINKEIFDYVYRDSSKNKIDDYIFEYKYEVVKDMILAFKLYDMYLTDPNEILEKFDLFINNLQVMTEEELLKIFGLESSVFEENIVFYKIFEQLKQEKKEISSSLNRIKFK